MTQVNAVIRLREDGGTVAFITRYRQDQTNGLDENQVQSALFMRSTFMCGAGLIHAFYVWRRSSRRFLLTVCFYVWFNILSSPLFIKCARM